MNKQIVELIKRRRLQTLIHAVVYYKFNETIISDADWTKRAKQLVELQRKYPEESKEAPLFDMFCDFDYSTGMNLVYKADDAAIGKAKYLIAIQRGKHGTHKDS